MSNLSISINNIKLCPKRNDNPGYCNVGVEKNNFNQVNWKKIGKYVDS
jgi:hypothetical protein